MKIKCSHCSEMIDVTIDCLIFENEDEELFVTYLSSEMSKETCLSERDCVCGRRKEEEEKKAMNIKCLFFF